MNEKKMTVNPMWVLFLGACPALRERYAEKGIDDSMSTLNAKIDTIFKEKEKEILTI